MKRAPVLIKLYLKEIQKADLLKELDIDKNQLVKELVRQPGLYAWWATLYSKVMDKTSRIRERLEYIEASAAIKITNGEKRLRVSDIKHKTSLLPRVRLLRKKLKKWENSERILKYAVRAFEQRKDMLQMIAAQDRREKERS